MTYDQAQSPRLGQRTPVESTYVQIFDVDPATPTADLVEAAWPGMLIFRQDRSILQIYDGAAGAWADVAGGVAGQLTYVGTEEPTDGPFTLGDTWYDSDDGYKVYIWDGDSWEASTAAGGISTYHLPGFQLIDISDPDLGFVLDPDWEDDPDDPTDVAPPLLFPIPDGNLGDIWYQSDDNNRMRRWNGTVWADVRDDAISANQTDIYSNAAAIETMNNTINELGFIATSVNNSADTADGRVSMSDYMPSIDDLLYETKQMQIDETTGLATEVTVFVPRVNGSIWFTRTRPRQNLAVNPSLELNDNLWVGWGTNVSRVLLPGLVPAGDYTLHAQANTTPMPHEVRFAQDAPIPCEEGQIYTASVYAELKTDVTPVPEMLLQIVWLNNVGGSAGTDTGDPYSMILNGFDPTIVGTTAEPRAWVTAAAPSGAVSFYVTQIVPPSFVNVEWNTGAMLIEQEDDLGRYFDGDSYPSSPGEAYWEAEPHGSYSNLTGDKIMEIWELRDGDWNRKYLTSKTIYSLDASKLIGTMSGSMIADSSVPPTKMLTIPMVASEALAAGDIVNIWNDAGVYKIRKASAANRYEAHGYVVNAVTSGAFASVFHTGYVGNHAGLPPGNIWLSTTAGRATGQPPSAVGQLVQRVGFAPNSGILNFSLMQAIRIT